MIKLEDKNGVTAPTPTFPYGAVRDDSAPGVFDGTGLNADYHTDYAQFFSKMFDASGLVSNGLPDNQDNGWQLYDAFRRLTKPYRSYIALGNQSGVNAPVITVLGFNEVGDIVWTYSSTGTYYGTLTGAFPAGTTFVLPGGGISGAFEYFVRRISDDQIEILSFVAGSLANSGMVNSPLEIRVYD